MTQAAPHRPPIGHYAPELDSLQERCMALHPDWIVRWERGNGRTLEILGSRSSRSHQSRLTPEQVRASHELVLATLREGIKAIPRLEITHVSKLNIERGTFSILAAQPKAP